MERKSPQKQLVALNGSSEDSSFEDSASVVQPLHQGHIPKLWHKKVLQEYHPHPHIFFFVFGHGLTGNRGSGNYASPTDNILSPCTKKLQAHKKRHYNKYLPYCPFYPSLSRCVRP